MGLRLYVVSIIVGQGCGASSTLSEPAGCSSHEIHRSSIETDQLGRG